MARCHILQAPPNVKEDFIECSSAAASIFFLLHQKSNLDALLDLGLGARVLAWAELSAYLMNINGTATNYN